MRRDHRSRLGQTDLLMPPPRRSRETVSGRACATVVGTATGNQSKPTPKLGVFLRNVAVGIIRHHDRRDNADNRAEGNIDGNRIT
jgi:hypothetical protein